jgi:hypothetical protein
MSTENLKVVITGDVSDLDTASAKAAASLKKVEISAAEYQKRAKELGVSLSNVSAIERSFAGTAAGTAQKVAATSRAMQEMNKTASSSTNSLFALSGIVQDAPYGFRAIANNVTFFTQQMAYSSKEAGGFGAALKGIGKAMIGPAGIIVGISVVTSIITGLIQKYGSLSNAATALFGHLTDQAKAQKLLNDAIKDSSDTIQTNIAGMLKVQSTVKLAQQGYVSAKTAVGQFNKELGNVFGNVNSLAQAQDKLNDSSQAYIQATIYKTVATKLFSQAAKAVTDNIALQAKSNSEAATGLEKTINFLKAGFNFNNSSWDAVFKQMDQLNDKSGAAEKSLSQLTTQNSFSKLTTQAQGFLQTAAKIAKQFDIGIFGGGKSASGAKGLKSTSDIMADLSVKLKGIDGLTKGWGLSIEQVGAMKMEAIREAINTLYKTDMPNAIAKGKELQKTLAETARDSFLPTLSGGRAGFNASGGTSSGVPGSIPLSGAPGGIPISNPAKLQRAKDQTFSPILESLKDLGFITDEVFANVSEKLKGNTAGANLLANAFENVFSAIANGGNPFQALLQTVEQLVIKLAAAAAISAALNAIPGASGVLKIFDIAAKSFAGGGFIPSPTLAVVGDAPGGEWVLNQRQMSAVLKGVGNGGVSLPDKIELIARGGDLMAVVNTAIRKSKRRNGYVSSPYDD